MLLIFYSLPPPHPTIVVRNVRGFKFHHEKKINNYAVHQPAYRNTFYTATDQSDRLHDPGCAVRAKGTVRDSGEMPENRVSFRHSADSFRARLFRFMSFRAPNVRRIAVTFAVFGKRHISIKK